MARRELIPAKKEKAEQRVKNFRKEMAEYRAQFEKLKGERQEAVSSPFPFPFLS
jgi:Golgi SNAP receptor complex protein 2